LRPGADAGPTRVAVGIWITDISRIDSVSQTFSASLALAMRWHDPALAHHQPGTKRYNLNDIWHPDWLVANAYESIALTLPLLLSVSSSTIIAIQYYPRLCSLLARSGSDTRDHRGHPTHGALYRGALTNYWDRTYDAFTFHTWEAEGAQYVPLADARVVLAFHGWTVGGHTSGANVIPFYMLPAIGGSRTLRDYHDFQFHDRNLLVAGAESRFAVWEHLDAALFMDAGNVASRYSDLNLDKTSYGAGLRLHTETTTLARLDVARGAQGWHAVFSTSEPFRLPRVRKTMASVPFAP